MFLGKTLVRLFQRVASHSPDGVSLGEFLVVPFELFVVLGKTQGFILQLVVCNSQEGILLVKLLLILFECVQFFYQVKSRQINSSRILSKPEFDAAHRTDVVAKIIVFRVIATVQTGISTLASHINQTSTAEYVSWICVSRRSGGNMNGSTHHSEEQKQAVRRELQERSKVRTCEVGKGLTKNIASSQERALNNVLLSSYVL